MIKCHTPHSTLLVASEDNAARSGQQGVQVIPSVLWDPRSGHSPPWFALRGCAYQMGSRGKLGALPQAVKTLPPVLQHMCESRHSRRFLTGSIRCRAACRPGAPSVTVCDWQPVLARPQYRCISPKARVQHCMLTRWISCNIDARLDPKGKPLKIKERQTTLMFLWGGGCGPRK